jgi:hypothetical protein
MDIRHSYGAKDIKCIKCMSVNIKKNLSNVLQLAKKCYNIKEPPGNEVEKAISEGREEIKTFKEKQQQRVYKKK